MAVKIKMAAMTAASDELIRPGISVAPFNGEISLSGRQITEIRR
jgi:hypothetical protein